MASSDTSTHGPGSLFVEKYIELEGDGTGGTRTTLKATQTTDRSLNYPDADDTLVGKATTDTLTNKTILGSTNTVEANGLKTTGAPVYVDTAAPPGVGYVLKATTATTATWQQITAGDTGAKATYHILENRVKVTNVDPSWKPVAHWTWLDSRYSLYSNGILIFNCAVTAGRTLSVRLRDVTNNATLGSLLAITSATDGFKTFAVTNPSADAQVELQVFKDLAGGSNPEISGAILEFDQ